MSLFTIAVISPRLPSPVGKADSRTVYNMIDYLVSRGHEVHLATFVEPGASVEAKARIRSLCKAVYFVPLRKKASQLRVAVKLLSAKPLQIHYYEYEEMCQAVGKMLIDCQPDVAYSHLIRTAEYLAGRNDLLTVLGMQISQTLNYRRMIEQTQRLWTKTLYSVEHRKVKRYEPKIIEAFDRVLLISPQDKRAADPEGQSSNVFFNPHGVEVGYYSEDLGLEKSPETVVMNADFEAPTNVDAALFFYEDIWPLIREVVPGVKLVLAGRKPDPAVRRLAGDSAVTVTGFVKDIRPYLQRARVAIDPLRIGAGLQNKVLVSMASRLPVVATHRANEGIQIPQGKGVLLATKPEQFARYVVQLLQDEEERKRLGKIAQEYVQKYWTWEFHFARLERMLQQLIETGPESLPEQYYPFQDESESQLV